MDYKLSLTQKEIYKREYYYPGTSVNNISTELLFKKELSYNEINQAINMMIKECSTLRLQLHIKEDNVYQYYCEYKETEIPLLEAETSEEYREWGNERLNDCIFGYDLPLYRFYIVRIKKEKKWSIYSCIHHILADAISTYSVVNQIINNLENIDDNRRIDIGYEYSHWVENGEKYLNSKAYLRDTEFWQEKINEYEGNELPYQSQSDDITSVRLIKKIGLDITARVKEYCKENNVSIPCLFYSVYSLLKCGYTYSNSSAIAITLHNRGGKEKHAVGMYVTTLPLIINLEKEQKVTEFLKYVKLSEMQLLKHHRYTYGLLQQNCEIKKGLLDFGVTYQNFRINDTIKNDYEGNWLENGHSDLISVSITEREADDRFMFEYSFPENKYKREFVESLHESVMKIIIQFIDKPESYLKDIEIICEREKALILNEFNATATEYPRDKTVAELFEEQVLRTPNKPVLVFEDKILTYSELNAKANSLAHKLRGMGVKPDDYVAITADKSIEMICGIYGIIKAGGAYVPIDPTYPEDRIKFMLEDCKPKTVLMYTTDNIIGDTEIPIIDLADSEVWEGATNDLEIVNKPSDLIYCIYTSGTTGKPKGVMVEHRNVVKLVKNCDYTELNEETVILQTGQLMFDASTFEMWGTSLNGGTLHLVEKETMLNSKTFKKYMTENGVNTLFITTALFNQFMNEDKTIFDGLKHLMFGGEATSERYVEMLRSRNTGLDFRNVYGPTETTTFAAHYIIDKKVDKTPIGKPISNTTMYVLNGDLLCGIGVPGELCIGGDGVARGYLNRAELTAEKFVKNPFGEGRMYRSGDLAKWLPDGNIEYLGRLDEQV
ncbi:MAG: amino acid adenylation domain-containing protein, partial [Oscillospiraceae bacterium]|nr:amino acid adenylation domain-containing protein [Oscillospiraceae bacterium]